MNVRHNILQQWKTMMLCLLVLAAGILVPHWARADSFSYNVNHTVKVTIDKNGTSAPVPSEVYIRPYYNGKTYGSTSLRLNINSTQLSNSGTLSLPHLHPTTAEVMTYDFHEGWMSREAYRPYYDRSVTFDPETYTTHIVYTAHKTGPLAVKIILNDYEDVNGLRPETIAPVLTARADIELPNGGVPDSLIDNGDGTWIAQWDNVPFFSPQTGSPMMSYYDIELTTTDPNHYVTKASVTNTSGSYNYSPVAYPYTATFNVKATTHKIVYRSYVEERISFDGDYYEPYTVEVKASVGGETLVTKEYTITPSPAKTVEEVFYLSHRTYDDEGNYILPTGFASPVISVTGIPSCYTKTTRTESQNNAKVWTITARSDANYAGYSVAWVDNKNALGLRPAELHFVLRNLDTGEAFPLELDSQTVYTSENSQRNFTSINNVSHRVPELGPDGTPINWRVEIEEIPYYTLTFNRHGWESFDYCQYCYYTATLREDAFRTVRAGAVWEDENNIRGKRPTSVILTLLANGEPVGSKFVPSKSVDASTNWETEWTVPINDTEGNPINYTVKQSYLPIHKVETTQTTEEDGATRFTFTNVLQEDWNYSLNLVWDTTKINEKYDRYEIDEDNNDERSMTYKLTINVNAARYEPGELQVRLPWAITKVPHPNGTGSYIGPTGVGLPKKPQTNDQFAFHYWIDTHGTTDKGDDELVFENHRLIEDSLNQTVEVKYVVKPHQMVDTVPSEFTATGSGLSILQKESGEDREVIKSNTITYGIDTGISYGWNGSGMSVQSTKIEGDYVIFRCSCTSLVDMNQYSVVDKFYITAEGGGEVSDVRHGTYRYNSGSNLTPVTPEEDGSYKGIGILDPTSYSYGQCNKVEFTVKYPLSTFYDAPEGYKPKIMVDSYFRAINEHENDKIEPHDYNDLEEDHKELEVELPKPKEFHYTGTIVAFSKGHTNHSDDYRITRFEMGLEDTELYNVTTTVNGYNFTSPFAVEVGDDALYMRGTYADGTITDWIRLTEKDYALTLRQPDSSSNHIRFNNYDRVEADGSYIYFDTPKSIYLEGKQTVDGEWETIKVLYSPQKVSSNKQYSYYEVPAEVFEGKRYVGLRARTEEGCEGYGELIMYLTATIFPDSPVFKELMSKEGLTKIEYDNYSLHHFYTQNQQGSYDRVTELPSPYNKNATTNGLNAADFDELGYYQTRANITCYGSKLEKSSGITKSAGSIVNDVVNSKVDVPFTVTAKEYTSSNLVPEYQASCAMEKGVFYDLLPSGYVYMPEKGVTVSTTNSKAAVSKVETVDNYKETGRQLVKFYVENTGDPGTNHGSLGNNQYGCSFTISFWASITWHEAAFFPYGYNLVAFQEGDGGTGREIAKAALDEGAPTNSYFKDVLDQNGDPVFRDINDDGITDRRDTLHAYAYVNPDFIGAYQIGIAKLVKANSGHYQIHDIADLGGTYSYKLIFSSSDNGYTRDLILFDILEDAANTEGNHGIPFWKGSFAGVSTRMPVAQGIAPVVYYSTRTDLNSNQFDVEEEEKISAKAHLQDTSIWSTTPPEDLSKVTAVAFDLSTRTNGTPFIFDGQSSTEVEIFMTAPEELPEADLAYNRFSYGTISSAYSSADETYKHNIGHRVTVELRDLKDFTFLKLGEGDFGATPGLGGIGFNLYKCSHVHDDTCTEEGCSHTHSGTPGSGGCWNTTPVRTSYSLTSGEVSFKGLDTGSYAIKESSTHPSYIPLNNMWWLIDVVATYGGGVSEPVNGGTAKPHVSMIKDEQTGMYTLLNERRVTDLHFIKEWVDDDEQALRPESIFVDLYRNGKLFLENVEITPDNNWNYTFKDVFHYSPNGQYYEYTLVEHPVDGYESSLKTSGNIANSSPSGQITFTVTNKRMGALDIHKQAQGGLDSTKFTFAVEFIDIYGKPLEAKFSVQTIAADGTVITESMSSNEKGVLTVACKRNETLRILNIPAGSSYTVAEKACPGYTSAIIDGSATGTVDSASIPSVTFGNTYDASGTFQLTANKLVNGEEPDELEDGMFTFTLSGGNLASPLQVTNSGSSITFPAIAYNYGDLNRTYIYTLSENALDKPGYSIDDTVYTVHVHITDNGDGTLTATPTYLKNGQETTALVFDNPYRASGQLVLEVAKKVNDRDATDAETGLFTFTLTGDGISQSKTNSGATVLFDAIAYNETDAGKTFNYTVSESSSVPEHYTADSTQYTVEATITDNRDGTLNVTKTIRKGEEAVQTMEFHNSLTTDLTISKQVVGDETDEVFEIKVWLHDSNGTELTEAFAYTGDQTGELKSGDSIMLGHGQQIVITDLAPGIAFTVEETANNRYSTAINGQAGSSISGQLPETGMTAAFVNTLKTTSFSVVKEWQGGNGEILLTLYANGVKMDPQPVISRDGDTYSVTHLPLHDLQGNTIVYSAEEKYMDGYITIYQNKDPYASYTKQIYNGGTIINRAVTDFSVRKVWNGLPENAKRPKIKLELYCNGVPYHRAQPEPDDNGVYHYKNLPKVVNGQLAVYSVCEVPLSGYKTTYLNNGKPGTTAYNGGVIVNSTAPVTADHQPLALWFVLITAATTGLMILTGSQMKKRRNQ